jgi:hypothetical protein
VYGRDGVADALEYSEQPLLAPLLAVAQHTQVNLIAEGTTVHVRKEQPVRFGSRWPLYALNTVFAERKQVHMVEGRMSCDLALCTTHLVSSLAQNLLEGMPTTAVARFGSHVDITKGAFANLTTDFATPPGRHCQRGGGGGGGGGGDATGAFGCARGGVLLPAMA